MMKISNRFADFFSRQFLIVGYEESICPKGVGSAGRASYVERNQAMIRESDVCIFTLCVAWLQSTAWLCVLGLDTIFQE